MILPYSQDAGVRTASWFVSALTIRPPTRLTVTEVPDSFSFAPVFPLRLNRLRAHVVLDGNKSNGLES